MIRYRALYSALPMTVLALACATRALPAQVARGGAPLSERLAPATREAIERLADSLTQEGLPAYAIRDKAAEGVLKGADDRRLLTAVNALAGRLRASRRLLGASGSHEELVGAASALYVGVSDAGIERLVRSHRRGRADAPLAVPLNVLAELVASSVPADAVLSSIEQLLSRGARDADFAAFRRLVDRDLQAGRAPRDALSQGTQGTLRRLPPT